MGTKQKGPSRGPPGEDKKVTPIAAKLPPDRLPRRPEQLLEYLQAHIPNLKISEQDLELLASKSSGEIGEILENFVGGVQHAAHYGMVLSFEKIIENAATILSHDGWRVFQLRRCVEDFQSDIACDLFLSKYIQAMGKHIYWKPLVDELNEYDEESIIAALMFDDRFEQYLCEWDGSIVMAEEAVTIFGFAALPALELGGNAKVVIGNDQAFFTSKDGQITIAPYVGTWDTREDNLADYQVSIWHEIGHHKWRTFHLNMHPDVFDYGSLGARFVASRGKEENRVIIVEKDRKRHEIKEYADVVKLARYPDLLQKIHNWVDDGRVDQNNMEYLRGLRDKYHENIEQLLMKRPKLEDGLEGPQPGEELLTLLEATLQYAITGKTVSEVPKSLRERFSEIAGYIDGMERGMHTDGTASLNVALKIYRDVEGDVRDIEKALENLPQSLHDSSTSLKGKNQPMLTFRRPAKEGEPGENGQPGEGHRPGGRQGEPKEGHRYDGFDGEKLTQNEHCVVESEAEGELLEPDEGETQRIRSIFQKYSPKQGELERGLEDGEVDPELFQEYMRQLLAGRIPEKEYYSKVVYEERDVSTGVLVDLSGSTDSIRGEILHACGILGTASQVLRDPLIIAGFTTGDDSEDFILMKDVHEEGIRMSDASGATPMGGPLRHMCARMMRPGIRHKGCKQIFLITDGQANVGKAPLEDAAHAVEDAWKRRKIKVFGIGITSEYFPEDKMAEYFDQIFGVGNYLIVSQDDVKGGRLHVFFERYYRRMANKLR